VVEAAERVIEKALAKGIGSGAFAPTPQAAQRWLDAGATFVALSVDTRLALDGFSSARAGVSPARGDAPR
jgi:4-hydroxy-2-oxoheptanedioate aldolase